MKKITIIFLILSIALVVFGVKYEPMIEFSLSNREFLGFDFGGSLGLSQNLLNIDELLSWLYEGSAINVDSNRLETLEGGFHLLTDFDVFSDIYLGAFGSKIGVYVDTTNNLSMHLPYTFLRVFLHDPTLGYEENLKEDFSLITGGLFFKVGILYGGHFNFGKILLNTSAGFGGYLPVVWADPDSTMTFYYNIDPENATLEVGFDGESKLYSAILGENANPIEEIGYYVDLAGVAFYSVKKDLIVYGGLYLKSFPITPAKASYEASATVGFGLRIENLEVSSSGDNGGGIIDVGEFSETISKEVKMPIEFGGVVGVIIAWFDSSVHFYFTEDISQIGINASFFKFLWVDITKYSFSKFFGDDEMKFGIWKKSLGIGFDIRFIKISGEIGVYDDRLFSLSQETMRGPYTCINVSVGF